MEELEELVISESESQKNFFEEWLTDGKEGGALQMLTHYDKGVIL